MSLEDIREKMQNIALWKIRNMTTELDYEKCVISLVYLKLGFNDDLALRARETIKIVENIQMNHLMEYLKAKNIHLNIKIILPLLKKSLITNQVYLTNIKILLLNCLILMKMMFFMTLDVVMAICL